MIQIGCEHDPQDFGYIVTHAYGTHTTETLEGAVNLLREWAMQRRSEAQKPRIHKSSREMLNECAAMLDEWADQLEAKQQ